MEKREEILKKVTELYMKYGIRSVTMNDVSRELGISKKTLYLHVKDKEDLVRKVIFSNQKNMIECISLIWKKNLNSIEITIEIGNFITNHLKNIPSTVEYDLAKYYPQIYKDISAIRRQEMCNLIIRNINKGIKEGLFRADLKPDIVALVQIHRMETLKDEIFKGIEKYTLEEALHEILIYHLRGICSTKGIEFLENKLKII